MAIDFKRGTLLKARLTDNDLTLKWLCHRLLEYSVDISISTLSLILNNGYRNKELTETVLTMTGKILDRYEEAMRPHSK